jgi:hypothetical protein
LLITSLSLDIYSLFSFIYFYFSTFKMSVLFDIDLYKFSNSLFNLFNNYCYSSYFSCNDLFSFWIFFFYSFNWSLSRSIFYNLSSKLSWFIVSSSFSLRTYCNCFWYLSLSEAFSRMRVSICFLKSIVWDMYYWV